MENGNFICVLGYVQHVKHEGLENDSYAELKSLIKIIQGLPGKVVIKTGETIKQYTGNHWENGIEIRGGCI